MLLSFQSDLSEDLLMVDPKMYRASKPGCSKTDIVCLTFPLARALFGDNLPALFSLVAHISLMVQGR